MPRKELRSVEPVSALKIGCLWSLVFWAIFGCCFIFLPMMALPSMFAPFLPQEDAAALMSGGFISALIAYVVAVLFYAFIGALMTLIGAIIYNLIAQTVGGLEVDVEE